MPLVDPPISGIYINVSYNIYSEHGNDRIDITFSQAQQATQVVSLVHSVFEKGIGIHVASRSEKTFSR